jgi:Ser/Thr protein kinase RdoA (MazF antagonist)
MLMPQLVIKGVIIMENKFFNIEKDVKFILNNSYNIHGVQTVSRITAGYGSECYHISAKDNSYIFKLTERNPTNHLDQLQLIHEVLSQAGIPVAKFYQNNDGQLVSQYKEKACFLQEFIKGTVLKQNTAPDWFMVECPTMLGKIHKALESIPLLSDGMGEGFLNWGKSTQVMDYYQNSLETALANRESKIASDIKYRMSILDSVRNITFDLTKFTRKNTHGDYKIDQIICGENKINGVIDIDACVHPICWEIIRSYTYADPECINGNLNIENLKRYVECYLKISELNNYDLKMMPYFYYFQLAVCNYFGQYYGMNHPNRKLLLENAHWSTSLCRWFEHNVQKLSDQLVGAF